MGFVLDLNIVLVSGVIENGVMKMIEEEFNCSSVATHFISVLVTFWMFRSVGAAFESKFVHNYLIV